MDDASSITVVTGATHGIGRETARQLAARGAHVVLACRNLPLAEEVAADIRAQHPGCRVDVGPAPLDLASLASVRRFAAAYRRRYPRRPHCLVNNAGANTLADESPTAEGVGRLVQVNYLGPYALTRLLLEEGDDPRRLQEAAPVPARVVNLSSCTHRFGTLGAPLGAPLGAADVAQQFLSGRRPAGYADTKLGNCLFAYELQRRLGEAGVQSCAVEPGGVASDIWKNSRFAHPPLSWVIGSLYAPPSDGAAAVVHAATVPWGQERAAAAAINRRWARSSSSNSSNSSEDLRHYARGLFASPLVTQLRGTPQPPPARPRQLRLHGVGDSLRGVLWGLSTLVHSCLDWPLRKLSGGRLLSQTRCVPSAPLSYDPALAAALWDASADRAGLPRQPRLQRQRQR